MAVFLAVADARSFRVAAEKLGVTRPAVSQTIRRLEDRLGVALVRRTSVSPTEAGKRLYQRVAPAICEVGPALDATADRDSAPCGLLRLAVSSIAEQFISGPLLARFADLSRRSDRRD
jgi:DNA-binding transcriptional LysR family regulator